MKKEPDTKFCNPVQVYLCNDLLFRLEALGGTKSEHIRTALRQYLDNKEDPLYQIHKEKLKHQQAIDELNLKEMRIKHAEEEARFRRIEKRNDVVKNFEKLKPNYEATLKKISLSDLIKDDRRITTDSKYLGISKEELLELIQENFF